jgi:hypothetical protein
LDVGDWKGISMPNWILERACLWGVLSVAGASVGCVPDSPSARRDAGSETDAGRDGMPEEDARRAPGDLGAPPAVDGASTFADGAAADAMAVGEDGAPSLFDGASPGGDSVPDAVVSVTDLDVPVPDTSVSAADAAVSIPDGRIPVPDAATIVPDALVVPGPDAAMAAPDAAMAAPDAAMAAPDAAVAAPDAAVAAPDAAVAGALDAVAPAPDAVATEPDADTLEPDAATPPPPTGVALPGVDGDGDGWTLELGDCDDVRAETYPFAAERADGRDNDCDGLSDEPNANDLAHLLDTQRLALRDFDYADVVGFPVGTGDAYTHCSDGDGFFMRAEFRAPNGCGFDRFPGDLSHLGEAWSSESGEAGEPVLAIANGVVVLTGTWGDRGAFVVVRHEAEPGRGFLLPDGTRRSVVHSLYGRVDGLDVADEQPVARGDVIGYIASVCSGCAPHLYWEVIVDANVPVPGPGFWREGPLGRVAPSTFAALNRPTPPLLPDGVSPCTGLASGDYCGDNGPRDYPGNPDDLVTCRRGALVAVTPCPNGCTRMPAGFDDVCRPVASPERCNGLDDDVNGVVDDLEECWQAVARFVDAHGAYCYGVDAGDGQPPASCPDGVYEVPVFLAARQPLPGTYPVVQCSVLTDHILVEPGSADHRTLLSVGYDCSAELGHLYRAGQGPRVPVASEGARVCDLHRFSFPTPGGGAHLFTTGGDAVEALTCEPPARTRVVTDGPCFPAPPPNCVL